MDLAMLGFIIAFGFVTSALLSTAELAFRGQRTGFAVSFSNLGPFMAGFVFCMFAGPYVVLERSLTFWRLGGITIDILALCFTISLLWSFCSGIFITQLLMILGVVPV